MLHDPGIGWIVAAALRVVKEEAGVKVAKRKWLTGWGDRMAIREELPLEVFSPRPEPTPGGGVEVFAALQLARSLALSVGGPVRQGLKELAEWRSEGDAARGPK
jgi:hypothetical protein